MSDLTEADRDAAWDKFRQGLAPISGPFLDNARAYFDIGFDYGYIAALDHAVTKIRTANREGK